MEIGKSFCNLFSANLLVEDHYGVKPGNFYFSDFENLQIVWNFLM